VKSEQAAFLKEHTDLLKALKNDKPELAVLPTSPSTVHLVSRFHGYTRKQGQRLFS